MTRAAAITQATVGASKLWAGTMVVQPDAKTGPHHHGELETVLYVVKGRRSNAMGRSTGTEELLFVYLFRPIYHLSFRILPPDEQEQRGDPNLRGLRSPLR
jgi:hypothetical protein